MQKFVAISLFAVAAAAGCVAPDEVDNKVIIVHNVPPGEGCSVEASEDTYMASGQLDVQSGRGYYLTPLLKNFASSDGGRLEEQRIFFATGADVSLAFIRSSQLDTAFSVNFSSTVTPDGGLAATAFDIMPPALMPMLRTAIAPGDENDDTVVATVQVFGDQGGQALVTRPFSYPIRLCNGCSRQSLGLCTALPEGFEGRISGGVCSPFQDGFVQCCTTSTGFELCPAAPEDIVTP